MRTHVKTKSLRRKDVHDTLMPLYLITKLLGLSPYSLIRKNGRKRYTHSPFWICYSVLFLFSFVTYYVFATTERNRLASEETHEITNAIDTFQLYSGIIVMAISVLANCYHERLLLQAVKKLVCIDEELEKYGLTLNHGRSRVFIMVYAMVLIFVYAIMENYNCSMFLRQTTIFSKNCWFMCYIPLLFTNFVQCQFTCFVILLWDRYHVLNQEIARLAMKKTNDFCGDDTKNTPNKNDDKNSNVNGNKNDSNKNDSNKNDSNKNCDNKNYNQNYESINDNKLDDNKTHIKNDVNYGNAKYGNQKENRSNKIRDIMKDVKISGLDYNHKSNKVHTVVQKSALEVISFVREMHCELCACGRMVNKVFSLQLLLIIGNTFASFTSLAYYCFGSLSTLYMGGQFDSYGTLTTLYWAASKVLQIAFLSVICTLATNEASRTGKIIFELNQRYNPEFAKHIDFFGKQILHWSFKFTAYHFFDLDMTLLYSVICGATTYLIILVQLDDASMDVTPTRSTHH